MQGINHLTDGIPSLPGIVLLADAGGIVAAPGVGVAHDHGGGHVRSLYAVGELLGVES